MRERKELRGIPSSIRRDEIHGADENETEKNLIGLETEIKKQIEIGQKDESQSEKSGHETKGELKRGVLVERLDWDSAGGKQG